MMDMQAFFLPVFGFLIGIVASMTGVGGGIFIVPILVIVYGFVPQEAVGTSLASIVFTAGAATVAYSRQKRIFYRTGLLLALATVPGAYLGAYATTVISPDLLGVLFGIFLLFIALRMVAGRNTLRRTSSQGEAPPGLFTSDLELIKSRRIISIGIGLSLFAGFASGFFGVGGGVLSVPIMTLAMSMPIHMATATSMFTMVFTSVSGIAKHYLTDHVHVLYALLLACGTIFGAHVGANISKKISGTALRRIFGLILILMSIQMILKFK